MRGSSGTLVPGTRIGDYIVEHDLPRRASEQTAVAATHVVLPRRVQIVTPATSGNTAALQLLREAWILDALRHPGVPRVYECGRLADRRPWVALEIVEGSSVEALTIRKPFGIAEVAALLRDCAAILEHAHLRGATHHAICPAAVVRNSDGYSIVDWHAATLSEDREAIHTDDVRALGAVAYRALSRMEPTVSAARRCPSAPARLTALVDRMLAGQLTATDVRAEIGVFCAELANPLLVDDGTPIEEVDVVLVDISRDPPPVPKHEGRRHEVARPR
jgi:serine/threonine protein kinase